MRYLIKYTKHSSIKFISHLDLMRTIHRVIRRSGIDVEYSKGYNPHISLSIAQPLAVGVYSEGEYLDLIMNTEIDEDEIIRVLNENSPMGVKFLEAVKLYKVEGRKIMQSMAAIDGALYTISFALKDKENTIKSMDSLIDNGNWEILKTTKNSEKVVNIRKYVKEIKYWEKDNKLVIRALVSCGSRENLSPQLLSQLIIREVEGIDSHEFIDIKREELYVLKDEKYIPLGEYFKSAYGKNQ
ncbi:TIGR03936 family radical SAM-associated protein [Hathewaya proteolytica]|uniref:TIGR03936 family radical SAM-associated protein n=1 Tax=Hathewaya proteolytica TaxID=29365 RepID=UPI0009FD28B1|nr:TIGR03936 family radical SAM-associated protein [Hathewaya proteolytica]